MKFSARSTLRLALSTVLVGLSACAPHGEPIVNDAFTAGSGPVGSSGSSASSSRASTTMTTASSSCSCVPSPETEAHAMLADLVAVDTSRGRESDALRPLLRRLTDAGIDAKLLEASDGRGNIVARLRGDGSKKPLLLLAHVNVESADAAKWSVPPFSLTEKDGYLWGRGVGGDKALAAAFTATILELKRSNAKLSRDVILALTAGEGASGSSGLEWLIEKHKDLLDAEVALNSGGEISLSEEFGRPLRIGFEISQPTQQTFRIAPKKGPDGKPMLHLTRALERLETYAFPAHVTADLRDWFRVAADDEKGDLALALKHAAVPSTPLAAKDEQILAAAPAYANLLRTTCTTVSVETPRNDAFAPNGAATIRCRMLPGDKRGDLETTLKQVLGDGTLEVSHVLGSESSSSPVDSPTANAIRRSVQDEWYGIPIVPTVGSLESDGRLLREMGVQTYGIAATATSHKDPSAIHGSRGNDERRPAIWVAKSFRWTRELTRNLAMK